MTKGGKERELEAGVLSCSPPRFQPFAVRAFRGCPIVLHLFFVQ